MKKLLVLCMIVGFAASLAFAQAPSAPVTTDTTKTVEKTNVKGKAKATKKSQAKPKVKKSRKKTQGVHKEAKKDTQQGQ